MLFNKDLQRLFEIMNLDPETVFKGGLGVYDQQQAEVFIEKLKADAYNEGYDSASAEVESEIEEAIEEKEAEVKEDIGNYIEYHLYDDYKKAVEREGRPPIKEEFEVIKDLILENI